jgi:hypothetical protein
MTRGLTYLSICLAAALTTQAAPPSNDDCENAITVSGEGVFSFDNTEATEDGPPASNCGRLYFPPPNIPHDVWYCWTAPSRGWIQVDTCGGTTVDTKVEISSGYSGPCECAFYAGEACWDDACGAQARVLLEAWPGYSYLIRIGTSSAEGVGAGEGTFTLSYVTGPLPYPPYPDLMPCEQPEEHCQPRVGSDAFQSDAFTTRAADNFTVQTDGEITGLCWWGAYFDGESECYADPADTFEVRYYLDAGGVPGPRIAGPFTELGLTLSTMKTNTSGGRVNAELREYEHSANHDPVPVLAGECYWIEIVKRTGTDCRWLWSNASGGDGRAAQDGRDGAGPDGYDTSDVVTDDLAFGLDVPLAEPAGCIPEPPFNDECTDSMPITDGTTFFDNLGATTDGPPQDCTGLPRGTCCDFPFGDETVQSDIWFDYTAECNGAVTLSFCDAGFDTKVAVYDGPACPADVLAFACNDDACSDDPAYHPLAQSDGPAGCDDSECAARVCRDYPFCCESLWYPSCAEAAGTLCPNTRVAGPQSEVNFRVRSGHEYKLRIGGYRGDTGTGTLHLEFGAPDATSLFDYATLVRCFTGPAATGTNLDPCCTASDFDHNDRIDLSDAALLATRITSP